MPPAQRVLAAARRAGLLVVHTLEAHKPDLSGELHVPGLGVRAWVGRAGLGWEGHAPFCFLLLSRELSSDPASPCTRRVPALPCTPRVRRPADLPHSKLARGNLPPGLRIGDEGAMGRILVAGEHGNGIVEEVAPIEVSRWGWEGG